MELKAGFKMVVGTEPGNNSGKWVSILLTVNERKKEWCPAINLAI